MQITRLERSDTFSTTVILRVQRRYTYAISTSMAPEVVTTPDFTAEADIKVGECVAAFRDRLVAEARDIESLQNPGDASKQVTPSHVHDANLRLRKYYLAPKATTPTSVYVLAVVTVVCGYFGGLATNNMKETWGLVLFAATLVIGVICAAVAVSKERR